MEWDLLCQIKPSCCIITLWFHLICWKQPDNSMHPDIFICTVCLTYTSVWRMFVQYHSTAFVSRPQDRIYSAHTLVKNYCSFAVVLEILLNRKFSVCTFFRVDKVFLPQDADIWRDVHPRRMRKCETFGTCYCRKLRGFCQRSYSTRSSDYKIVLYVF